MNELDLRARGLLLVAAAWIFALEYNLYLVTDDLTDKFIKVGAAVLIVLCLRYRRDQMPGRERSLLWLYYGLLLTALVPAFFVGNTITGLIQWMKIALQTIVLPLLLLDSGIRERGGRQLLSSYALLGVLFSIQGILAFFGVLWNYLDTSVVIDVGRRPDLTLNTLGIFGFANALKYPTDLVWLRPQGWFIEPSFLGAFLLLPAFFYLGSFMQRRRLRYLLGFVIVLGALLLTVSMAAYLGFIVGILFLVLARPLYRGIARTAGPVKYLYPLLILLAFLGVGIAAISLSNSISDVANAAGSDQAFLAGIYGRDPNGDSGNLFREVGNSELFEATFVANPIGIGFADTEGSNDVVAANGILYWGIAGGLPALVVLVTLFTQVYTSFCHPLLMSGNAVHRCLAASLIGHAIHNLSAGSWTAPYFLLHLVIVCVAARSYPQKVSRAASVAAAGVISQPSI